MQIGERSRYISTLQAAEAIGVSVSTIKRWVDDDVLPAHRTAGGHRKLLRAEVLALARRGELPQGDLVLLSPPTSKRTTVSLEDASLELSKALVDGNGADVSAIIHRTYRSGVSIESLADHVIAPALTKLGHDWETDRIDVWHEHRGTQLCATALFSLKNELESRAERNRPIAIGGAPEGDPYFLPSLLAQTVLLDAGWNAIDLGPNTPLTSMAKSIEELRPQLLWISVSHLSNTASFVEAYRELYRFAESHNVAVAIGGNALIDSVRTAIPYTTFGDGLGHLAAFAKSLHPRPRPPRRGRPPR